MTDGPAAGGHRREASYHGRVIAVEAVERDDGTFAVGQVSIAGSGSGGQAVVLQPPGQWRDPEQALQAGFMAGRRYIDDQDFDDDDDDDDGFD